MDGFVELIWENDEIVSRRRPSTFLLSQRGSGAGRNDSLSYSHGRTLHKKGANISIYNNNDHDHQTSTPTRNVFEQFSSPTQQRQLASADHDDNYRDRPLLLNLIKTSTTTTKPHDHHQQPKTVKRPLPADHAMHLVPDDHDHDHDDRQMPILDQDHKNYYCNHNNNHEAAVVPSLHSVGASNDHHLPNALYSVEQEQEPQTLRKRVPAPRVTRHKRDAPTTKLHNLSERVSCILVITCVLLFFKNINKH